MYAIVNTGGKQYKVQEGQTLQVEKLPADVGSEVVLDQVLFVSSDQGVQVGNPLVQARVTCEVLDQARDRKVVIFKHKKRKDYRRKAGHRQPYTVLKVKDIEV
ncbi:MAG: 50S ribosomal protein L21 [Desulfovermiculus sp.]